MTDMKYGARPEGANDSFCDMFFPLTAPLDILVTALAVIGFVACVARRHAQRHRARRHRPAHGRPRLPDPGQPAGHRAAVEPAPAAVPLPPALPADDGRRRRGRRLGGQRLARPPGRGTTSGGSPARLTVAGVGLAVLVVFGFMFEVLPGAGGGCSTTPRSRSTPGVRSARRRRAATPRATGGRATTSLGYEGRPQYPEYYDVVQTMAEIGRDQRAAVGSRGRTTRTTASTARRWR